MTSVLLYIGNTLHYVLVDIQDVQLSFVLLKVCHDLYHF
jgi:hypothetical protein